ncbi:hypothetical protein RFI_13127 [Reticulomyxa filosa]|uniref:XK-related protein n=1 Tax=Reticulomyxa filosa TaxID=46433 RepID=X6NFB5_RETFI|nr:hypothetical protein RFI_13127 [Reticulomyxa filosa]|eukprot:ETO24032.1 hypothetical protein RFI_13127 [Reticulomyxa filosa]
MCKWSFCFDCFVFMVSFFDFATDLLVMRQYYARNLTKFFWIGMSNLLFTQLCYCFVFIKRYVDGGLKRKLIVLLCVFPISPLLCIIFYCASFPTNIVSTLFRKIGLSPDEYWPRIYMYSMNNTEAVDPKKWVDEKLFKNIGIVLEGTIEAIPQILIQMSALIYTQQSDWLSVLSIVLSSLSFANQTIYLTRPLDISVFLLNWLAIMCDIFGTFASISWAFFPQRKNDCAHLFLNVFVQPLGMVWFAKVMLSTIPFVCYGNLLVTAGIILAISSKCNQNIVLTGIFLIGIGVLTFCVGTTICLFLMEFPCLSVVTLAIYGSNQGRYKDYARDTWINLFDFIEGSYISNKYWWNISLLCTTMCCCRRCTSHVCCASVPAELKQAEPSKISNAFTPILAAQESGRNKEKHLLTSKYPEFGKKNCIFNEKYFDTVLRLTAVNLIGSSGYLKKDDEMFKRLCDILLVKNRHNNTHITWRDLTFAHLRYFSAGFELSTVCEVFKDFCLMPFRKTRPFGEFQVSLTLLHWFWLFYLIGRVPTLLFPYLCLLFNLIMFKGAVFSNLLQLGLTGIHMILVIILIFAILPHAFWWYWMSWHILPGQTFIKQRAEPAQIQFVTYAKNVYESIIELSTLPILQHEFGDDIAKIIWSFIPHPFDLQNLRSAEPFPRTKGLLI